VYDPFIRGRFSVGVRTVEAVDSVRNIHFPCEVWYPADVSHFGQDYVHHRLDTFSIPGGSESRTQDAIRDAAAMAEPFPLVVYSHPSGRWKRQTATFLCTHLASHGFVVAALDHTSATPHAKDDDVGRSRVFDVTFLIDFMLKGGAGADIQIEPSRIGAVGHSFGGWTVLSAMETESRIRALAVFAPAGGSNPRPGVFPGKLRFKWKREAPTLYLIAENDVMTPVKGIADMFKRTPPPKRSFILRRADHHHFVDEIEHEHEVVRTTLWPDELKWISDEMRPASELTSGEKAQAFVSALTLAHFDANLLWKEEARHWFASGVRSHLAERGIDGYEAGRSART